MTNLTLPRVAICSFGCVAPPLHSIRFFRIGSPAHWRPKSRAHRVSRLLNRLEFLFELPSRLRRCIAVGADAQAVRYYRTASRILQRYQSVRSFERIRTESESIANGLRQVLRARVQDAENLSAADQIEVASMLIDLQEVSWRVPARARGA